MNAKRFIRTDKNDYNIIFLITRKTRKNVFYTHELPNHENKKSTAVMTRKFFDFLVNTKRIKFI